MQAIKQYVVLKIALYYKINNCYSQILYKILKQKLISKKKDY